MKIYDDYYGASEAAHNLVSVLGLVNWRLKSIRMEEGLSLIALTEIQYLECKSFDLKTIYIYYRSKL